MNKSETTSTDNDAKIDASSEVNSTKFVGKKSSNKISPETNADKQKAELSKSKTNEEAEKSKKTKESDSEEDEVKVPLLDQPIIIEGSRSRKTIISLEKDTIPISKKFQIAIPNGKGIPLGRIPIVNTRMKKLRQNLLKELHRALFGKVGKPANFIINFQKFRGFSFEKDSYDYNKKILIFNKFRISDLNDLLFCFDLDVKIKKKEDSVKSILDFLISPKPSKNSQKPPPTGHPKRKATKRNYYDFNVDDNVIKKRKKSKTTSKSKDEKQENEIKTNHGIATNSQTKNGEDVDSQFEKKDQFGVDNNNEFRKPAKKRKRNQVIQVAQDVSEESKIRKKKDAIENISKETNKKSTSSKVSTVSAESLADEDLKSFLKKVLADANLEETTMKTVYGLISDHYPNYDFSKKKDFIKEVVKSVQGPIGNLISKSDGLYWRTRKVAERDIISSSW